MADTTTAQGGGGSTSPVDLFGYSEEHPIYHTFGGGKTEGSRRMAGVAEQQANIAMQQWDMYKGVFAPYEAELVAAHRSIIPEQLGLDLARIRAQEADVSGRMGINEELRQQQMSSLQRSEPVEEAFYKEALIE